MNLLNKIIFAGTIAYIVNEVMSRKREQDCHNVEANTETSFNLHRDYPYIHSSAFIHPMSSIMGQVHVGQRVFVGPFASLRGDEGLRIYVGDESNVQDGVILHGLKNFVHDQPIEENSVYVDDEPYSIYIAEQVTLAHQCQVHGPCFIEPQVFVGMQAFVFNSHIEEGAVLEPGSKVIDVVIPRHCYVPAGTTITTQEEADTLPEITPDYKYYGFNQRVVAVNNELARSYKQELDLTH